MWVQSNIKCEFLAMRALATNTAINEVIKLPLFWRANKNFCTISSKLPNKSARPLNKTIIVVQFSFSFLAFSSSALYMAQTFLRYFQWLLGSYIQMFWQQQWAIDGNILSNRELFLTWPFSARLSFVTFLVRNRWNSNFEIEGTYAWFILQILPWYYGRKFNVLNFMKN